MNKPKSFWLRLEEFQKAQEKLIKLESSVQFASVIHEKRVPDGVVELHISADEKERTAAMIFKVSKVYDHGDWDTFEEDFNIDMHCKITLSEDGTTYGEFRSSHHVGGSGWQVNKVVDSFEDAVVDALDHIENWHHPIVLSENARYEHIDSQIHEYRLDYGMS